MHDDSAGRRFELTWASLPKGFSVAGLMWAARLFPTIECKLSPDQPGSNLFGWEEKSKGATYSVAAQKKAGALRAILVSEHFPGYRPPQPSDLGRAMASSLTTGDKIEWVVPLPGFPDDKAFARTKSGRPPLLAMTSPGHISSCVIEGLDWDAAAETRGQARDAANKLCADLYGEWKKREMERLAREFEKNPPVVATPR